jgi:Fic family protein
MKFNPSRAFNELPKIPPSSDIETKEILYHTINANKELARLNGYCSLLPNETILLNSIVLKEAKASSEIEDIITTQDEIYRALTEKQATINIQTKEVLNYRSAIWVGYNEFKKRGLLTVKTIEKIQEELEGNSAGIRKLPGTSLVNDRTDEVIYTPPDNEKTIIELLSDLERYINTDDRVDPLIKMVVIHYQFESIHPFYDGNGRTGRILNVLYLVKCGLLKQPILYLSDYIIKKKGMYYELLQKVRTEDNWEEWIVFILKAVEETAKQTLYMIQEIMELMEETIQICKAKLPKPSYSKELVELLFVQPYTKIDFLVKENIGERRTASKYLKQLEEIGVLESYKSWKETIYVNRRLFDLLKG